MPKSASNVPAKKPVSARAAAAAEQAREAEVKKVLDELGSDVYALYRDIRSWEQQAMVGNIMAVYKLGQRCNAIHTKYKHGGLQKFAWALGKTKDEIEAACRLASRFTDKDLQDFLALRTPKGESLTKSHLLELSEIDDKEQRKALAQQAANEGMSYRDLAEAVRAYYGGARSKGGRGFAKPASLSGLLSAWTQRSTQLLGFHDQIVISGLEPLANDTPPERITDDMLAQIDQTQAAVDKLRETAEADLERLTQLKARVVDVLAKRSSGQEPAPTPPPAVRPVTTLTRGVTNAAATAGKKTKPPGKRNSRPAPAKSSARPKAGKK